MIDERNRPVRSDPGTLGHLASQLYEEWRASASRDFGGTSPPWEGVPPPMQWVWVDVAHRALRLIGNSDKVIV